MRNPIHKRLKRDLWHNKGRYIAIFLITAAMIAIISGFFIIQKSVLHTFDEAMADNRAEDGQLTTAVQLPDEAEKKFADYDLTVARLFYRNWEVDKTMFRIYADRKTINRAGYYEGGAPQRDDEIALERIYAKAHGYAVGDTFRLADKDYRVSGIMALPDYSAILRNRNDALMDTDTFCLALVTQSAFDTLSKGTISYTYAFETDVPRSDKELNEVMDDLRTEFAAFQIPVVDGTVQSANQCMSYVMDDMKGDVPMMVVFFIINILVIAFVYGVISKSMIEDEAPVIGTMLAMGVKRRELIMHYLRLPVAVTLAAGIIGNIPAYTFIKDFYKNLYYSSFSLFPLKTEVDVEAFLMTTVLPLVLIILINLLMLASKLRFTPIRFLRKDLKRHRKRQAHEWKRLSFMRRYRLRVFVANRASYLVMFMGIFLAGMLLIFGTSFKPLMRSYADKVKTNVPYEHQYLLRMPVEAAGGERFTTVSVQKHHALMDADFNLQIFGIEPDSRYYPNYNLKDNEAYVSEGILKKYGLKIGDELTVRDRFKEKNYTYVIRGTNDYLASMGVFVRRERVNEDFGFEKDYFNGYFSDKELTIDENLILTEIDSRHLSELIEQFIDTFGDITPAMIGLSSIVFTVVIYILSKVIIERAAQSIGYLKVFGYRRREIAGIYVRTTTHMICLMLLICVPLWFLSVRPMMEFSVMKLNSYVPIDVPDYLHLLPIPAGLCIYFIVRFFNIRKIYRGDMVEALKDYTG
ncbi:MAG: ABC transporter permease [Eubacteriales bacterium]|nr:ABC transporter permease [Eubacteriales bacterium]